MNKHIFALTALLSLSPAYIGAESMKHMIDKSDISELQTHHQPHADWLDKLALELISKDTWDVTKVRDIVTAEIEHDQAYIDALQETLTTHKDGLSTKSALKLTTEIYSKLLVKADHERMLEALLSAEYNPALQDKLMKEFRQITTANARIKLLEDKENTAESAELRAELVRFKETVKEYLQTN